MSEYVNRAMELADQHGALRWQTGVQEQARQGSRATATDAKAVAAREALRQHLTSLPASGGEPGDLHRRNLATTLGMWMAWVRSISSDSENRERFLGILRGCQQALTTPQVAAQKVNENNDLPAKSNSQQAAPPAPSAALIAAVEALEMAKQVEGWWTDDDSEKIEAALSLCRAELDPTIAGEGENG